MNHALETHLNWVTNFIGNRDNMSKMTSVGSECETVGSKRERERDIVVGFESKKVQLALRERERDREWGGDGFEI